MVFAPDDMKEVQGASRTNIRYELDKFEAALADLRVKYEQYFAGILTLPPDKADAEVRLMLKRLRKSPFRSSAINFRLRSLETRLNTLSTYWQRVLREREDGVYLKDLFKAALRERAAQEEAYIQTAKGATEKGIATLFQSYKAALEKHTGRRYELDFEAFQRSIAKRAKELRKQHEGHKLTFKVVIKGGNVTIQARVKSKT